jgi:hypothetical protein
MNDSYWLESKVTCLDPNSILINHTRNLYFYRYSYMPIDFFWDSDTDELAFVMEYIKSTQPKPKHQKAPNIDRGRDSGHERIMKDYFNDGCTYPEHLFRRRFRMPKYIVEQIIKDVVEYDDYKR